MSKYLGIEVNEKTWIDSFPRFVLIRGVRWSIVLRDGKWKHAKRLHGNTDYDERTINIVYDQPVDDILDTLMHELTHLIWSEYELPTRPTEERVATAFGAGWSALFVQNPQLLRGIEALREAIGGQDEVWYFCPR